MPHAVTPFTAHLTERDRELPKYVQREFEDCLRWRRPEHGFPRIPWERCHVEHVVVRHQLQASRFVCALRGAVRGTKVRRCWLT